MGKQIQAYRKLFESLKSRAPESLYFLYGPEEHLKKEFIHDLLTVALPEGNRAFNLDVVHGDEFDRPVFENLIASLPLFNEKRVVILRGFKALPLAQQDYVISAADGAGDGVILVVETPAEKLDTARMRSMKKVADSRGLSFCFFFLDEDETLKRVASRFRREGCEISSDALSLLVESVGTNLSDLVNEVEKIILAAGEGQTIDRATVSAVVGKYRSEDLFSLLDALSQKRPDRIISHLSALVDGGEEPVFVLALLLRRVVLLLEVSALVAEKGRMVSSGQALAEHMAGATNPFYADKLRRQASAFGRSELERLLTNLRWADLKLKSTSLDAKCIIEESLLAAHTGKTLASPLI